MTVTTRHSDQTIAEAFTLAEKGFPVRDIARTLKVWQRTVLRWLDNPADFCPFTDPVAVERALGGDRAVFDNLTRWERAEFNRQVLALAPNEGAARFGDRWHGLWQTAKEQEQRYGAA